MTMPQRRHETASAGMPAVPAWNVVLRALRECRGVSQEGWAAQLGVARRTVQRWEQGGAVPDAVAQAALVRRCREAGLFRRFEAGPLRGQTVSADLLLDLLAEARSVPAEPNQPLAVVQPRPSNNLPAAVSSFVGREQAVADIAQRLQQARLLTLTGPGGIGKTRLAVEAARTLLPAFPDGVFLVDLTPVSDPELVPLAIARAVQIAEAPAQPLLTTVQLALRDGTRLLVLDNFEQVIEAAPVITKLLRACPYLRVLVTSRATLRLTGELVYLVPPLSLPAAAPAQSLRQLTAAPAMALFLDRAASAMLGSAWDADSLEAIAAICRRLDGLPLAIELAAARMSVLSPQALLSRLEQRFTVLTGGPRDLPARQRTLANAIAWSYELLSPAEQALFRRLAVFVGGFTLDACEAVCTRAGDLALDVLDGVGSLVDKSLLVAVNAGGERRFGMLETIREFGLEQLRLSGEHAALERDHLRYYLSVAEEAQGGLMTRAAPAWQRRLDAERDNLRAALTGAVRRGEAEQACRLVGALWLWFFSISLAEGRRWTREALALPGSELPSAARVAALNSAAVLASWQGDGAKAARLVAESLPLARRTGSALHLALALQLAGAWRMGDPVGRELLAESIERFRALKNDWGLGLSLYWQGFTLLLGGDVAAAKPVVEECLRVSRRFGEPRLLGSALAVTGWLDLARGQYRVAERRLAQALAIARQQRWPALVGLSLNGRGVVALAEGAAQAATCHFREALANLTEHGYAWPALSALHGLGCAAALEQRFGEAAVLLGAADAAARATGRPVMQQHTEPAQRALAATRAALGEAAFAAAWRAGQRLPLKRAVTRALAPAPAGRPPPRKRGLPAAGRR